MTGSTLSKSAKKRQRRKAKLIEAQPKPASQQKNKSTGWAKVTHGKVKKQIPNLEASRNHAVVEAYQQASDKAQQKSAGPIKTFSRGADSSYSVAAGSVPTMIPTAEDFPALSNAPIKLNKQPTISYSASTQVPSTVGHTAEAASSSGSSATSLQFSRSPSPASQSSVSSKPVGESRVDAI
ncbi:hypothetical protein EJ04DRAFT_581060 [Polyplosphaeria fusca]|uniref:Uncharacterized protein n=1 Tax=Polyplosphaeria fusca TaxID=682080 RepID=A0A9P4QPW6_9PLEO|nr:hypothetical protein EJ04DRAFT_581060 [Polyplosphaeria fusca]